MAKQWTALEMGELGRRHAELETLRDLEGTMATVSEHPIYEFWPLGVRLEGRELVSRYYRHLFDHYIPHTKDLQLIDEWPSENAVTQEYQITLELGGRAETFRVAAVLWSKGGPFVDGERIYASDRCVRLMLGDLVDELPRL